MPPTTSSVPTTVPVTSGATDGRAGGARRARSTSMGASSRCRRRRAHGRTGVTTPTGGTTAVPGLHRTAPRPVRRAPRGDTHQTPVGWAGRDPRTIAAPAAATASSLGRSRAHVPAEAAAPCRTPLPGGTAVRSRPPPGRVVARRPTVTALAATLTALALLLALVAPAPAGSGPTRLSDASVSPREAKTTTTIELRVAYRNREGSPADWVRVKVAGSTHAMTRVGGENWKRQVTFALVAASCRSAPTTWSSRR